MKSGSSWTVTGRLALGSPGSLAVAGGSTVGRPTPSLLGGGSWLRFKHPVVRCQVLRFKHPVVRCQVLTYAHLLFSLSPLLLPTFPHGPHGESHVPTPEQKMFRDRSEPTLFRAETVPETVPVLSLYLRLHCYLLP